MGPHWLAAWPLVRLEACWLGLVDVAEVYSPPRLTEAAKRFNLKPGSALDLTTGWDFSKSEDREEAKALLRKEQPLFVMLTPECGPWSQTQNLNDPEVVAQKRERERVHVRFCCEIAQFQIKQGLGFGYEQPWNARSWEEPELQELMKFPNVEFVRTDMCMFGLRTKLTGEAMQKATGILTNVPEFAEAIQRRCDRMHHHGVSLGKENTRAAQKFTPQFVNQALRGLSDALAK